MRSFWILALAAAAAVAPFSDLHASAGSKQYNTFLESGAIYADDEWQDYVTEVGERVLAVSEHRGRNYTFVVLDQTDVNAFTTGDGYVFLTRGIMAYFSSEDELAAVIGHEIGHVVAGHKRRRIRNAVVGEVLGWLGVIATNSFAMKDLANTLTQAAGADYSRQHELEADALSAKWLVDAGYNPQASVDMIQMLRDNDLFQTDVVGRPAQYHGIFRSHPEHQKRIHELVKLVDYDIPEEVRPYERDFMDMLDGLVFGNDATAGVAKDNVFYHGGLRFVVTFPEGWEVANTNAEIIGRAPVPGDEYVTVQRQRAPEEDQTPEEYVTQTLKRDDIENGQTTTIGENPAYIGDVKIAGGKSQVRKLAVIYKDGAVYLFKGEVGEKGDPTDFDDRFMSVLRSFRPMTAEDMKIANSRRIRIVEARPGDTFEKLARGAALSRHAEGTLRVINGKHPFGEPRAGDMIKVVK